MRNIPKPSIIRRFKESTALIIFTSSDASGNVSSVGGVFARTNKGFAVTEREFAKKNEGFTVTEREFAKKMKAPQLPEEGFRDNAFAVVVQEGCGIERRERRTEQLNSFSDLN